jgi:hypothetical protein
VEARFSRTRSQFFCSSKKANHVAVFDFSSRRQVTTVHRMQFGERVQCFALDPDDDWMLIGGPGYNGLRCRGIGLRDD